MSDLFGIFDADVEPVSATKFEKLPKGEYVCTLNKMTERERNGNKSLVFEMQVLEGEYEGRKIWLDLMVETENEKLEWLVKKTKGQLRTYAEALGFTVDNQPGSYDDFLDLPIVVSIGYRNDFVQLNYFKKHEAKSAAAAEWTF